MPAITIVTLVDDDGDEFSIALPGVYESNKGADIVTALQIAQEGIRDGMCRPSGVLRYERIEYSK